MSDGDDDGRHEPDDEGEVACATPPGVHPRAAEYAAVAPKSSIDRTVMMPPV